MGKRKRSSTSLEERAKPGITFTMGIESSGNNSAIKLRPSIVSDDSARPSKPKRRGFNRKRDNSNLRSSQASYAVPDLPHLAETEAGSYFGHGSPTYHRENPSEHSDSTLAAAGLSRATPVQQRAQNRLPGGRKRHTDKVCASCETTDSPLWRETTARIMRLEGTDSSPIRIVLCNACGIRFKKLSKLCGHCKYVPRKAQYVGPNSLPRCPKCNHAWATATRQSSSSL